MVTEQTNLLDGAQPTAPTGKEVATTQPAPAAVADEKKKAKAEQKKVIRDRFGQYLPKKADPIKMYRLWKGSIFADPDKADDEVMLFVLQQAQAAGIDPTVPKQIYALPFNTKVKDANGNESWVVKHNIVIGIEGMVTIADNTGQYGGTTKPEYEFALKQDGSQDTDAPISCTIGVHKVVQGVLVTSEQTVYFKEYTTGKNLWVSKPLTMLKKVAHAHAIRAAFSACKGLSIAEELDRGDVIDMDSRGNVIQTNSTADLQKAVNACKTIEDLQKYYDGLSPSDKGKAQSFVEARFSELG